MTSYEYIWHHIHSLRHHTSLWHSHILYSCHHTQDACHRIHCSWAITYRVWIMHICNMGDIKPTICMTSYEFYVTSQKLFMTSKHCIHDITSTAHDITYILLVNIRATVTMTRHLLCFWHYTQCIWHLTWWMNGNTTTVSDMIPNVSVKWSTLEWWHHTLCTYEIIPTACMTP